jgi:polysaccharide biosynthesis/export protein
LRGLPMKLQRVRSLRQAAAAAAVGITFCALGTGCETKSFVDPSEVGRYQKTPLVVPILDKLVIGVEAEELQFAGARDVTADDLVVTSRDYRVGPNDAIQFSIQDLVGAGTLTQDVKRVSESGKISLPYIGQLSVVGMTEAEMEDAIVRAYAEAQILPKAIVSVAVTESQNRLYTITGAITNGGSYPLMRGDLRLLEAISNARGASSETGIDYVYIIRHKQASATSPTTPSVEPGAPGTDPLAPQGRLNQPTPASPVFGMKLDEQPAPQTPEEARAAAEKLANELQAARDNTAAQPAAPTDPMAPPADPAADASRRDRVIQIEGAGTQPAMPGDPTITTIPPSMDLAPMPGVMPTSSPTGFEFTAPAEPTDQEIIKVPYGQLKRGELKYNVVIQPQDMIVVPYPQFGTYYMGGHIARTGAYNLPPEGMTLKQAVVSAGGLDQLAIPARTDVIRRLGPNQEMFVRVDLERIFTGLEPDVFLKPNDTVTVGTNLGAPFAAALRNAFRITYGFGFLYDRNYAPQRSETN